MIPCRSTLLLLLLPPVLTAQITVDYQRDSRTWTLGNGAVELTIRLNEDGRLKIEGLRDPQSTRGWTGKADSSLIALKGEDFELNHQTTYKLIGFNTRPVPRNGRRLSIALEDSGGYGREFLDLELYPDQPVVRYRTRLLNRTGKSTMIRDVDFLPWRFVADGPAYRAIRVNQWVSGGVVGNFEPREQFLEPNGNIVWAFSGAYGQQCSWLALRDGFGRGLFAGWEFDGRATASVGWVAADSLIQFSGSILDLHLTRAADEEFRAPWAFLGVFQGSWDDAGYHTQRFVEAAIAKEVPDPERFPYVIWDSWKYGQEINELTLRRNAEMAASLGIELFVIDLGWATKVGDWRADPRKFPSGLRSLSDYVHSLGMKFGLHYALAEAALDSPVLRQNPDWTSSSTYGYFGAVSICLSHQPVRDWLIAETVRMIDDYNVDWILQDGENMVKNCTKTTHTHHPLNSNWDNSVNGINAVVTSVQEQRPNTHWENCEDGGNMMTFNMVKNYVTSITCDDSGPLTSRHAMWGATYPFPPRYTDRYMPDEKLSSYVTRSFMFGGPWIFMNRLPNLSRQDLEYAASEIRVYKAIRKSIRNGKVFHLTLPPDDQRTDAIQSLDPTTGSAIVIVTRAGSATAPNSIRLRGLDPQRTYRVRFQDSPYTFSMTGAQLMFTGVRVNLSSMWSSEIVYADPE